MKATVIIIFVIFFIAASSYDQHKNTIYVMTLGDRHRKICIDESRINPEDERLKSYGFGPKVDESLKCYVDCLLKKSNITTEDGDVRVETITKKMPMEIKRNVVTYTTECQSDVKNNDCKRSVNQFWCIDSMMQKDEIGSIWFMYM